MNRVLYYGFKKAKQGFNLHAVTSKGEEQTICDTFDKGHAIRECERLNRIVDDKNRKEGRYAFE